MVLIKEIELELSQQKKDNVPEAIEDTLIKGNVSNKKLRFKNKLIQIE